MNEAALVINPRETGFIPLDFRELFGNDNPVILEIGSGKGRFLIASATEQPERNFIGIEKSLHYHRVIRDRVLKRNLANVRLINHDAFLVMQKMFAGASVAEVHIYFPDPWPRKREQKRSAEKCVRQRDQHVRRQIVRNSNRPKQLGRRVTDQ